VRGVREQKNSGLSERKAGREILPVGRRGKGARLEGKNLTITAEKNYKKSCKDS